VLWTWEIKKGDIVAIWGAGPIGQMCAEFSLMQKVHMYWHELLEKVQKGEIDPLKMVTHRVRIEDMAKVYADFDKNDRMQKVFCETRFSAPLSEGSSKLKVY
jgi:threonine dehydrogenase-like Zn-dependent dehydrogenase